MIKVRTRPLAVAASAMFPYSEEIEEVFTRQSRYGDLIKLHKVKTIKGKKYIWIPRNCTLAPDESNDRREAGIPVSIKPSPGFKPRNAQQVRVISKSSGLLLSGVSHVVSSPTGSGKTVMATQIISAVGKKTLILVPKEDIKDQWYAALLKFLDITPKDIGIIQGDICDVEGKKIVIAMLQSISKEGRYPVSLFKGFGLMVVDECHKIAADQFSNVGWVVPAKLRLGLSATPNRKDGKGIVLKAHIGEVMVRNTIYTLVPKVEMFHTSFKVPMVVRVSEGVREIVQYPHYAGRTMGLIKIMASNATRNHLIARKIRKAYLGDRHILVQSDTKKHLELIYERLIALGVPEWDISFYVGGLTKHQRKEAEKKKVLLSTYMYTSEGTDIPSIDTLVMATPKSNVVQIVGRILREHDTKKEPLVIDFIDSDSAVLLGYANKREEWYKSKKAVVNIS